MTGKSQSKTKTNANKKTTSSARNKHAALPEFIEPCLAKLAAVPPTGAEWVHEIKFDGYRIEARIDGADIRLLTRTGLDWTGRFGDLASRFRAVKAKQALIDGELIVENDKGASNFTELVADLKAKRTSRLAFVAFDLLFLNGADCRPLTLADRKDLLKRILPPTGDIRFSEHLAGDGQQILDGACRLDLEGIVSKRLDRPYRSGRHGDWIKSKCTLSDEFVVGGYLDSTAEKNAVGALALGYFSSRKLIYAGRVGTGFSRKVAAELWRHLQPLRAPKSPFSMALEPAQAKGVVWTRPELVAAIEYRNMTSDRLLRHASFIALRDDKPAIDVSRPPKPL